MCKNIDFLKSSDITNNELMEYFEIAITNPSAIVMELLTVRKPFIFIDNLLSYKNVKIVSCDKDYLGYIKTLDEMRALLSRSEDLTREAGLLYERVFGSRPTPLSVEKILNEFY